MEKVACINSRRVQYRSSWESRVTATWWKSTCLCCVHGSRNCSITWPRNSRGYRSRPSRRWPKAPTACSPTRRWNVACPWSRSCPCRPTITNRTSPRQSRARHFAACWSRQRSWSSPRPRAMAPPRRKPGARRAMRRRECSSPATARYSWPCGTASSRTSAAAPLTSWHSASRGQRKRSRLPHRVLTRPSRRATHRRPGGRRDRLAYG